MHLYSYTGEGNELFWKAQENAGNWSFSLVGNGSASFS